MTMRYVQMAEHYKGGSSGRAGEVSDIHHIIIIRAVQIQEMKKSLGDAAVDSRNFLHTNLEGLLRDACKSQKRLVGAPRFELGTSCAQGRRDNQASLRPDTTIQLILLYFAIAVPASGATTVHEFYKKVRELSDRAQSPLE